MNSFVEVPRERMEVLLIKAGFERGQAGQEILYSRRHARDARLSVVVYTSVAAGADDARGCGEDAIRVVAIFTWLHKATQKERHKNLYKARVLRVNSVDGVLERTIEKAREAYAACNDFLKESVH